MESEKDRALLVLSAAMLALSRGASPPSAAELAPLAAWCERASTGKQQMLPHVLAPQPSPDAAKLKKEAEAKIVLKVFAYWTSVCGHERAKLTPERTTAIKARLREGYDEDTLMRAVYGCSTSKWHRGEDPRSNGVRYDDLELIMRSGTNVEKFSRMAPDFAPRVETSSDRSAAEEIADLRQAMKEASEQRDRKAYDAANARLQQLKRGGT